MFARDRYSLLTHKKVADKYNVQCISCTRMMRMYEMFTFFLGKIYILTLRGWGNLSFFIDTCITGNLIFIEKEKKKNRLKLYYTYGLLVVLLLLNCAYHEYVTVVVAYTTTDSSS